MDERNGSQRALIVGLGISGMAMAKGLYECGWDVTVVERAPERRRGGYFVGLFAVGFAFCDPLVSDSGLYCSSNLFIILATACLLLTKLRYRLKLRPQPNTTPVLDNTDDNRHRALRLGISLLCFVVVLAGNLFNADLWNYNSGAPTEYLELFISLGIMTWALTIKSRLVKPKVKSSPTKTPRKA